jgi:hypothetical protein
VNSVPNRAHDPRRKAEPTYYNTYSRSNQIVPEQDRDWHSKDPEAYSSWASTDASINAAGEAMSNALKNHHELFSWDNPNHYLNK